MNSLLGVGGHLLSGEMGEFSYTISKYSRKWEMAEDPEVAGAERVLVPVHTFNGTTFHFGIPLSPESGHPPPPPDAADGLARELTSSFS